jgi:acetyl-CoA carboxylase biotin carboxyl carrier protein
MDTKDILAVLDKFTSTGLAELKYKEGSVEFHLKRNADVVYAAAPAAPSHAHLPPAPGAGVPAATTPVAAPAVAGAEVITSPIVGTVYRSPAPDAPAFVEEGKHVKKGDTLCIIEAMKVMNELVAEFDCEILRILVDSQHFVEYGTPLFEVRKK